MAKIIGDKVRLATGEVVTPQTGAWYDGQQYWGGTLSQQGQINPLSSQVGAGQQVSPEVKAQSVLTTPQTPALASGLGAKVAPQQPSGQQPVTPASTYQQTLQSPEMTGIQTKIGEIDKQIADRQAKLAEAQANINDNPFYSEATRTGKLAKLSAQYEADVTPLANQRQQLVSAYTSAQTSAKDIADLQFRQAQLQQEKTQTFQTEDSAGNVMLTTVDKGTGKVISKQPLGQVGKPQKEPSQVYAQSNDVKIADDALANVDTNNDGFLSKAEYEKARQEVYAQIADPRVAASALETASKRYKRWNW